MKLKYLGHSCFLLYAGGKRIVFDPFIRANVIAEKAGVDIDMVEADYILVSHGHNDHTADLMYLAERTGATVVGIWEVCSWVGKQGYTKTHPMNAGGEWNFDFGKVKLTAAIHSSSFEDGSYAGMPVGFIIQSEGKTLYYAGDTALTYDMKITGERYSIDYAFLPIGNNFTMGYEDACIAADYVKCNQVIGMHYDTFGYIKVDHAQVVNHFKQAGKTIQLIPVGSEISLS